jgi:hypothetical protein
MAWLMKNELERTWKEEAVDYFEIFPRNLPEKAEENNEKPQGNIWDMNMELTNAKRRF